MKHAPKGVKTPSEKWMLCENSEGRKVYSKNDPCYPQCPLPDGKWVVQHLGVKAMADLQATLL